MSNCVVFSGVSSFYVWFFKIGLKNKILLFLYILPSDFPLNDNVLVTAKILILFVVTNNIFDVEKCQILITEI